MFAEIRGNTTYYQSYGQGPPVVFVHGLGGTSNAWYGVGQAMRAHHHCVAPDLRGHGRSDAKGELSLTGWAEDLKALISHLELPTATLVGHSMGSLIVQLLAHDEPDLCDRLVLVGGISHFQPPVAEGYQQRADTVEQGGMDAVVDDWLQGAVSPQSHASMPGGVGLLREMMLRNDPDAYARSCRTLVDPPTIRRDEIGQPTLMLAGTHDASTPLAMAEELKAAIPVSDVRVLPDVAHWSVVESPGAVAANILEFLT